MAKRRTAADWATLVEGWKRSGLGGVEFSTSAGISVGQLRWWKWHLGKRPAKVSTPKASKRPAMVRVELRAPHIEEASWSSIDVVRAGWVVRVRRGVDDETLEQVLEAIAARSTC